MPKKSTPSGGTPRTPTEVTLTRGVTINLGDFESMRFEVTATTDDLKEGPGWLRSWVGAELDEWISAEVDPFACPRAGPKPAGQVAQYYKDQTSE